MGGKSTCESKYLLKVKFNEWEKSRRKQKAKSRAARDIYKSRPQIPGTGCSDLFVISSIQGGRVPRGHCWDGAWLSHDRGTQSPSPEALLSLIGLGWLHQYLAAAHFKMVVDAPILSRHHCHATQLYPHPHLRWPTPRARTIQNPTSALMTTSLATMPLVSCCTPPQSQRTPPPDIANTRLPPS